VDPELQAVGQVGRGGGPVAREAPHREEQLVLTRRHARPPGFLFGEAEKDAQCMPELGEGAVFAV
jgi:hypothetical protein